MTPYRLDLPGGDVMIYPKLDLGYDINWMTEILYREVPWEQRSITIHCREIPQPRLIAWYGDHSYTYSRLRLPPRPMDPLLINIGKYLTDITGTPFNGVLLNLYPDGRSSIGMHSDDELEFGPCPTIASLSLGAERVMKFERKDKSLPPVKVPLTHGSGLIMAGHTQDNWKHGIDKVKVDTGPRINLTFRNIVNPR